MYYTGMTVYAQCPECNKTLIDTGENRFITCDSCGGKLRSRVFGKSTDGGLGQRVGIELFSGIDGVPISGRRNGSREKSSQLGPLRSIGGILCSLVIFVFIILLIVNFVSFFPAVVLTAPELLKEHHNEIRTELPLIIDNTPPSISNVQGYTGVYFPGQPIHFTLALVDEHLVDAFIELGYNNVNQTPIGSYPLRFNYEKNVYIAAFQAPLTAGEFMVRIIAKDYAGNSAITNLDLQILASSNPTLELISPSNYAVVNSSTTLEFIPSPSSTNITHVSYDLDEQILNETLTQPYSIPTSGWSEGLHHLNISISTSAGMGAGSEMVNYQNFSIFIDDTPPNLSSLSVTPLTIARKDTFQDRLKGTNYYRGEFVKLNINITDQNLASAQVVLEDRVFRFLPVDNPPEERNTPQIVHHTILPLPTEPGEYELSISTLDLAGNSDRLSYDFKVARIRFDYNPVPILDIDIPGTNETMSLPVINSSTMIKLPIDFGDLEGLNFTNATSGSTIKLDYQDSLNLSGLSEGEGVVGIHAKSTFHYRDYIFISIPYPPYLFVLPHVLTGWSLFGFFIFIAVVIILSNLYLFKSSSSGALKQLDSALKKSRAPMMESQNAIIMLAQLFLAVYSFNWIYYYILQLGQVPTRTPDFSALSDWALIYNLTSASVYEEIISRILLIGIPLLIIHALLNRLKKSKWKYLLGGGFEINKITIILIIFSSITFGLAHAPGWDYWKVLPTFISGFALGYLYIRKGIFAAILLHFTINFLSIPLLLLNYSIFISLLYFFAILFFIFMGIIYIGYYITRIFKLFKKKKATPTV